MIEVTGVNKMFGEIKALDNIVATIQEGSIFGLIGTNGAGKSTLLRVKIRRRKRRFSFFRTMPIFFRMQRQKRWQNIIR